MSVRRPAAGRQVAAGVLRVDAARAIAKLRDFQLADPSAWILEAIRAAVASGATSVSLDGDSDDIWLSWAGDAWPVESFPELLNELVSPGGGKGREYRLLATAINSALGTDTAYVDVYGFDDGGCQKLRYSPALLEADEEMGNTSTLASLKLVPAKVPSRAPQGCALFLHLHRKLGFRVLRSFLRGQPLEFALVRSSCLQLPIPIDISGEILAPAQEELLAVNFGREFEGGIALLPLADESSGKGAMMEIAEYGVRIISHPAAIVGGVPLTPLPIQVTLNSERMPTNASRSDVRRGDYPVRDAEALLQERFAELCQLIAERYFSGEEQANRLRPSIVALLAGVVSGPKRSFRIGRLLPPFQGLAKLPLLQNAVGEWRQVSAIWESDIVYRGTEALPQEYRPWVGRVLWAAPESCAERLLGPEADGEAMSQRLRTAKAELKSQRRFLAKAKRPASFKKLPKHWVHCEIATNILNTSAPALNVASEGELCLLRKGAGGILTILLDGREIEEMELPSPLPFQAIVSSKNLAARADYQAVLRNRSFDKVIGAVKHSAVRAVEAMCELGAEGYSYPEAASQMELRALVIKAMHFSEELGLVLASDSPLGRAKIWTLKAGRGLVSLSELRSQEVVGIANSEHHAADPNGRMVVVSETPGERGLLVGAIGYRQAQAPDVVRYDFRDHFFSPAKSASVMADLEGCVSLLIDTGELLGLIAWGVLKKVAQIHYYHCGKRIETVKTEALPPHALIMIDSSRFVPNSNWGKLKRGGLSDEEVAAIQNDLVRAAAAALVGDPPLSLVNARELSLESSAGRIFVEAMKIHKLGPHFFGESLWQRLGDVAFFARLDGSRASANQLAADFDGVIDSLNKVPLALSQRSTPGLESGWNPLIGSPAVVWLVSRLSGAECHRAVERAKTEATALKRHNKLLLHRRKWALSHKITPGAHSSVMRMAKGVVEFELESAKGWVGIGAKELQLHYFIEGRFFRDYSGAGQLPLLALISVSEDVADERFEAIPRETSRLFVDKLAEYAPAMLTKAIADEPNCLQTASNVRAFCHYWLRSWVDYETFTAPTTILLATAKKGIFSGAKFLDQRGVDRPLEDFIAGGSLRISLPPDESWVEAVIGQETSYLDEPLLALSQHDAVGMTDFLRSLFREGAVVDYSEKVKSLQVERRLAMGLLRLPTVEVDSRYKRRLGELVSSEKLGEIGFHPGQRSEVRLFRDGELVSRRELKSLPAIWIAIDDPELDLLEDSSQVFAELFEDSSGFFSELLDRVAVLSQALALSVVGSDKNEVLPDWLRDSLAQAMACGHLSPVSALAKVQVFATTCGEFLSWQDLESQERRFGGVWFTEPDDRRTPLAKGQFALALGLSERNVTTTLLFWQADEDLRMDALARENRSRPKATSLELSDKEAECVVAMLPLSGLEGLEGVIAPLKPDQASMREVRAHRKMQPIGKAVDPCSWPTICVLEYPELSPDRSWSAPQEDQTWEELSTHLRHASDDAITTLFPVPPDAITSYWVGAYVESKLSETLDSEICVRGRLWITKVAQPGSVVVHSRFGRSTHSAHAGIAPAIELPIQGELWLHSTSLVAPGEIVQEVAKILYGRMLAKVAKNTSVNADQRLSHLAFGVLAQAIKEPLSEDLVFDCFDPPLDSAGLLAMALSERPVAIASADASPTGDAYLFVPKATALFDSLLMALSYRMEEKLALPAPITQVDTLLADLPAHPQARPGHVLNPLADAVWKKLLRLGPQIPALSSPVAIAPDRVAPMVAFEGDRIILGGECLLLLQVMASHPTGQELSGTLVSVLASHCIEVIGEKLSGFARENLLLSLCRS